MKYRIGEIAKLTNLTTYTLRYYEKENIIQVDRDENNQRIYSDFHIQWLDIIQSLKLSGMSLSDIKRFTFLKFHGGAKNEKLAIVYDHKKYLEKELVVVRDRIKNINQTIKLLES